MFGHKEKAAIAALAPQHQALLNEATLAVTQSAAQWGELFTELAAPHPLIHRHHLPPRTLDVVVPLIRVISQDVDPTAGIGVRLDLRGPDAAGKTGASRKLPAAGRVTKAEEAISWDPWFVVSAPLRNGAELEVSIVDVTRSRHLQKRSQSGKIKRKTKAKVTQRVVAKLTTAKDVIPVPPPPSPATGWLQVSAKPKGSRHVVLARGKYPIPVAPAPGWQVTTVLLVLAEVFRWVPPAPDDTDAPSPVAPMAGAPA